MTDTTLEAIAIIERAKTRLLTKGWTQDGNFVNDTGQSCLVGALADMNVSGDYSKYLLDNKWMPEYTVARNAVDKAIPDGGVKSAIYYNDRDSTTFNDVMAVLDNAILDLKEGL